MTERRSPAHAVAPRPGGIVVEPWPAGGWVVRLRGHPTPVSRHDTEEEANARAAAYTRGIEREGIREVSRPARDARA